MFINHKEIIYTFLMYISSLTLTSGKCKQFNEVCRAKRSSDNNNTNRTSNDGRFEFTQKYFPASFGNLTLNQRYTHRSQTECRIPLKDKKLGIIITTSGISHSTSTSTHMQYSHFHVSSLFPNFAIV